MKSLKSATTASLRRFALLAMVVPGLVLASVVASADAFDDDLLDIQHRWAQANYEISGKEQKKAFEALLADARRFPIATPTGPRPWYGTASSPAATRG